MLDHIYPEEEQRFFTDREHTLAVLGLSRDLLGQGVRKHLALSGFRRAGKTVALKEFLRRNLQPESAGSAGDCRLAYIDLPRLVLTPEGFVVQYVGYLLYWMLGDFRQRVESFFQRPSPVGCRRANGSCVQRACCPPAPGAAKREARPAPAAGAGL